MVDLEKLSEILRNERETDTLQYHDINLETEIITYLNGLIQLQDECIDYRELSMITDEYKNAMIIIEGITERRFAKMVNHAILSITKQTELKLNLNDADQKVLKSFCNELKQLKNNMQYSKCLVIK